MVYGMFVYHAAGTGRWSSRGVELQNMARGSFSEEWVDEEMDLCCKALKAGETQKVIDSGLMKNNVEIIKSVLRGVFYGNLFLSVPIDNIEEWWELITMLALVLCPQYVRSWYLTHSNASFR